jgi:LacI family transcriptional regulator
MASIVDVARRAQVGIATVSRAINGGKGVREETRLRIEAAMRELSYVVPQVDRRRGPRRHEGPSRRDGRSRLFEVRVLHPGGLVQYDARNPLFAAALTGLDAVLNLAGHRLEVRNGLGPPREPVDGTVFIGPYEATQGIPTTFFDTPAVWLMGDPGTLPCDHVYPNHHRIGLLTAEYALRRGHRHGAYIGLGTASPRHPAGRRAASFAWRFEASGGSTLLLLHPDVMVPERSRGCLADLIDRLVAQPQRPSVLLVESDKLTPRIYAELRRHGLHPMHDLEVISCNLEESFIARAVPRPICIDLCPETIGRLAAERLLLRCREPTTPLVSLAVEPRFVFPE